MKKKTKLLLLASTIWLCGGASLTAQSGDSQGEVEDLVGFGGVDPNVVLPTIPFEGAFGFSKTALETPRSVSLISAETIESMSLSAVEDLARVVPGVFTTTRFGIQGGIDVRNVNADTYFRGMRRLSLQGNARSVLAAMDTIEVVKGPPSPIFGMGKIGGYTNVVPKSGRARSGQYLQEPEGFLQAIGGSFDRREVSFGVGGPLSVGDREGGYFVYGLLEDSNTFTEYVPVKQEIVQMAVSLDDIIGQFRLEAGFSYQMSRTAGALMTRISQNLVDNNIYIRGRPLKNLDLNGNGHIGIRELFQASPIQGSIGGNNLPLLQRFDWPRDANGDPYPVGEFPIVPGIPQAMFDYLEANPQHDPDGIIRARGVGGPIPQSGHLPIGFVLDPMTVGFEEAIHSRSGSFEEYVQAELTTGYVDFINDRNPDFTIKNQLFMDRLDQFKYSYQPVSRRNYIQVFEEKLTVTRRFQDLPEWLELNSLVSANLRYTESRIRGFGGDYGASRVDTLDDNWNLRPGGRDPNTTFMTPIQNNRYEEDGTPFSNAGVTRFNELGLGVLFDADIFENTNILFGGRIDRSSATTRDLADALGHGPVYVFGGPGTSQSNPMRPREDDLRASGTDTGTSWSVSLSQRLPYNLHPYVTAARSSVALDGSNNFISRSIINEGHIGEGGLLEAGLKGSLLDNKLFFAVAVYEQKRTDVQADDDNPALLGAFASSTKTDGVEVEVKWVPTPSFYMTAYFLNQKTLFQPNRGGNQRIDGRLMGFEDITDPNTGEVIFPAEAFLYGGHARVLMPDGMEEHRYKAGNPQTQAAITTNYKFPFDLGVTLSANYLSSVDTGRLGTIRLPSYMIYNLGFAYTLNAWDFKLDFFNITDERQYKARTGDNTADFYMQALPGMRWQASVRHRF